MAESWVGGDIGGIQDAAEDLAPCEHRTSTAVEYLDTDVTKLAGDAGWSGDAATAFVGHWEQASAAALALGECCTLLSSILSTLATNLDRVDTALRAAAAEARAQGAVIGTDGQLEPTVTTSPEAVDAAQAYTQERDEALELARGYRLQADRDVVDLLKQIAEPIIDPAGGDSLSDPDKFTLADYLRGFGAAPVAARGVIEKRVEKAQKKYSRASREWQTARAETPLGSAMSKDVKDARSRSVRELNGLASELNAKRLESHPIAGALDTKISDALGVVPGYGAKLSTSASESKLLKYVADLPIIDVGALVAGTYFQAEDDISKGEDPKVAIVKDTSAGAIGLAGGAVSAEAITAGLASVGVGAGVGVGLGVAAIGGAVGVIVGDAAVQAFHEPWSADIHEDGVVRGVANGIGNVASTTGQDTVHLAKATGGAIENVASSIWHGVF